MTFNDHECTLDVRLWQVSDSTIPINVARGGGGSGLEGLARPPPCGQLTRWFSAVAELLVCSKGEKLLKSMYIYGSYRKIKTGVSLFWTTR